MISSEEFSMPDLKMQTNEPVVLIGLFPVEFGQVILIAASRISEDLNSDINLIATQPKIAMQISIRKNEIVRNHRVEIFDQKTEECDENLFDPNNKQPIKKDDPFLLSIFINEEKFHIAIDEKPFCTFKHRIPFKEITKIELINFTNITQVDQRSLHPKIWPPAPYINSETVFSSDVPDLFQIFHKIIITGRVISTQGNFDIHFQSKNTNRELFLMRITIGKNTIELKAMDENGKYVNEETKNYPFFTNQIFKIRIACIESQFGIAIDGEGLGTYTYVDKDLLDKMTGFKIRTSKEFKLDLCSVVHDFFPTKESLVLLTELPIIQSRDIDMLRETFVAGLACPMSFPHSIIVEGIAGDKSSKPIIHLGTNAEETVALGLVIDFQSKIISRNIQNAGKWGTEETTENLFNPKSLNPIVPGKDFKIRFTAGHEKFFIAINDCAYCTYKYRLPLEEITKVIINSMQTIKRLDHHTSLPSPWPLKQHFMIGKDFANDIPVKFKPGHLVVIGGLTQGKGWFTIDFYDRVFERNLIHFNVRFDESLVARAWKNKDCEFKDWDTSGGFPFRLNAQFRISIAFAKDQFLFGVNGSKFCSYKYHDDILEKSTGLKLSVDKGLTIQITEVDHVQLDSGCYGYEDYSKPPEPPEPPVNPDEIICSCIGKRI